MLGGTLGILLKKNQENLEQLLYFSNLLFALLQ